MRRGRDRRARCSPRAEAALPADVAVCAAAVADWRVAKASAQKLKKAASRRPPTLRAGREPRHPGDAVGAGNARPQLVVGFAAETEDVVANAVAKRARKGCDWIVANDVSPATGTFGGERERGAPDRHRRGGRALADAVEGRGRRAPGRPHRPGDLAGDAKSRSHRRSADAPAATRRWPAAADLCDAALGRRAGPARRAPGTRADLSPRATAPRSPPAWPSPCRRASRRRCGPAPASRCRPASPPQHARHHRRRLPRRGRGDPRQSSARSPFTIRRGDRIAQLVVAPVARGAWQEWPSRSPPSAPRRGGASARPAHGRSGTLIHGRPTSSPATPATSSSTRSAVPARRVSCRPRPRRRRRRPREPGAALPRGRGVGTLGIIDDDTVALSNLQRQVSIRPSASACPRSKALPPCWRRSIRTCG